MGKKKVKNVESEMEKILEVVENNKELKEDEVVQTLITEYYRLKTLSDKTYKVIDDVGVSMYEVGSKGQEVFKSNPLLKDYANISSKLVSCCSALKEIVSKQTNEEDDWMF